MSPLLRVHVGAFTADEKPSPLGYDATIHCIDIGSSVQIFARNGVPNSSAEVLNDPAEQSQTVKIIKKLPPNNLPARFEKR